MGKNEGFVGPKKETALDLGATGLVNYPPRGRGKQWRLCKCLAVRAAFVVYETVAVMTYTPRELQKGITL